MGKVTDAIKRCTIRSIRVADLVLLCASNGGDTVGWVVQLPNTAVRQIKGFSIGLGPEYRVVVRLGLIDTIRSDEEDGNIGIGPVECCDRRP